MASVAGLPERDGYRKPYKYPNPRWRILAVGVILFVSSFFILFEHLSPIFGGRSRFESVTIFFGLLFLLKPINVQIHERVHYILQNLLGYRPEMKIASHKLAGMVYAPGQYVNANHNFIILLSPLIVLNFVYALIILLGIHSVISLLAAILFIDNSIGANSDVYGAYYDYLLPDNSLVYFPEDNVQASYIYRPI